MAVDEDKLTYWNMSSYFCSKKCGCAEHGFPGYFAPKFDGVLLVSQCPGYSRMPYGGQKKRTWEYKPTEMAYEDFQKLYLAEFASNRAIGTFYLFYAKSMGLELDELTFTSLVKCPFKDNNFDEFADASIAKCKWLLHGQIDALKPDVIVALGRAAIDFFQEDEPEFSTFNLIYPYDDESRLQKVVTFTHPSRVRNQEKEAKKLADLVKKARGF